MFLKKTKHIKEWGLKEKKKKIIIKENLKNVLKEICKIIKREV